MDLSNVDIAHTSLQLSTDLSKRHESLHKKVQALEEQIEDLQYNFDAFLENAGLSRWMHKFPELPRFTGSNSLQYDTWELAVRSKLEYDGDAIGDSKHQFYYVWRHVSIEIQMKLQPQFAAARSSGKYDFNDILDFLSDKYSPSRIYGKPEVRKPNARKPKDQNADTHMNTSDEEDLERNF